MKEQDKIPTSRLERAGKFLNTGARVGGNYLKYYGKRVFSGKDDRDGLQVQNAEEIYNTLGNLKGGALKIAQMMSMDEGVLPEAFTSKFAQAQYSAPPLSFPLVAKTFKQSFGKGPMDLYDSFTKNAVAAASIGQVHQAEKGGKKLAVKVQYPGVGDSIVSDLKVVRPLVGTFINISANELNHYMEEVQERLLEETDYQLELKQSVEISEACAHIEGLQFPKYYPELSAERILTMDWLEGQHLDKFLQTSPSQEIRNKIGQVLWDFYDYQIHKLRQLHADPHPGNFLLSEDGTVGILDFGCVKNLDAAFYDNYFRIMDPNVMDDPGHFSEILKDLQFLHADDTQKETEYFKNLFVEMHQLFGRPFFSETFDFGDKSFFAEIFAQSERFRNDKMIRRANAARGPKDAIYLNRTYFGLYTFLHKLKADIRTDTVLEEAMLK